MFRRAFTYLLVPILLLQSSAGLFIMTAFYANRSYIAQNLCENRSNEFAASCAGQCVLMKKLKKQQEKEQKLPDLKVKEVQLIGQQISNLSILPEFIMELPRPVSLYREEAAQDPDLTPIFHPPLYS